MPDTALASRPAARIAYAGLLAGIAAMLAWFTLPALGSTYNEGFQTSIVMNAYAILHGGLADVDPLHGLNNDFLVYTRLGVSIALAGLIKLGLPAAAAFRLLMLGSLGLLVAANAGLLAWRYRIPPLLACVPALLFPGLFESAWFFNDNVLSAALSSTAILLFWSRASLPATAGAAVLWGLAVACRSDAALIAPAFAVLGWYALPDWGTRLRHALVAGPIAVVIPVLIYASFGLNILDILPLTRRATELWARKETWAHILQPVIKGFALPGLLILAVGAVSILRQRRRLEMLLCLAVPLLYALAYGRMLTEVRYLLPLTPFFGILMVEGWNAVQAAGAGARRLAAAAFAVALLACFVPPVLPAFKPLQFMVADHDMPRPPLGRFWSPVLGMWWNRTLDEGAAALAGALEADVAKAAARPDRTALVVSVYWSSDRMVDLILREHGFALAQAEEPEACHGIGEMFIRDGVKVLHLRPHLPMIPTERAEFNWRTLAVPCLQAVGPATAEPVLVAGWTGLLEPTAGLDSPGVDTLLTPALDINPLARSIARQRYSYYVAEAPAAAIPSLLEPALDAAELAAAQAALADARGWSASALANVR